MKINISKTKVLHISDEDEVTPTLPAEAKKICKHECSNIGCNKVFFNVHGLKVHQGRCRWSNYFLVDKILDVCGAVGTTSRKFLIRWSGYGPEEDRWRPRQTIFPGLVTDYLKANDKYDYDFGGTRCIYCDLPCKNDRGAKIHQTRFHYADAQSNHSREP